MFGAPILPWVWWAAIINLGESSCWAQPISTWNSFSSLAIFRSVYQESNEIVWLFWIDSLNKAWVWADGTNIGTNKNRLLFVIVMSLDNWCI